MQTLSLIFFIRMLSMKSRDEWMTVNKKSSCYTRKVQKLHVNDSIFKEHRLVDLHYHRVRMHVACRLNKIISIKWHGNKFLFYTFTIPVNSTETALACGSCLIFFNVEATLKINYFFAESMQGVYLESLWRYWHDGYSILNRWTFTTMD